MGWFLYLIECEDGSLYTGIAIDPLVRYALHLAGKGARYTRSHPPRRLLLTLAFPDRSSASKAEHQLKKIPAREKRSYAIAQGATIAS
jgi:putative endonuclease